MNKNKTEKHLLRLDADGNLSPLTLCGFRRDLVEFTDERHDAQCPRCIDLMKMEVGRVYDATDYVGGIHRDVIEERAKSGLLN